MSDEHHVSRYTIPLTDLAFVVQMMHTVEGRATLESLVALAFPSEEATFSPEHLHHVTSNGYVACFEHGDPGIFDDHGLALSSILPLLSQVYTW